MAKSILSFEEFASQTKETKELENTDALEESCDTSSSITRFSLHVKKCLR